MLSPLSDIQKRILAVLADGRCHRYEELMPAVDEFATRANVSWHVCVIRKHLAARSEDIVYVQDRGYRHVRLLTPDE